MGSLPREKKVSEKWHTQTLQTVYAKLHTQETGLSSSEASARLTTYGANQIALQKPPSVWRRFFDQCHNILIYILLFAVIVSFLLGQWLDAMVILGVVVINAIIGVIQEGKAQQAILAIRNMLSLQAMVLRDGQRQTIPAAQLVPGDMVLLTAGDKVPADLRLIQTNNLNIQEAALTGESLPVSKSNQLVAVDTVLGERECMAYAGTLVTYGRGMGVVVATGHATEMGRISHLLRKVKPIETPLLQQLARFGRWLTVFIIAIVLFTVMVGLLFYDYPLTELLMAAVGIAVAAIPSGLPAVLTIILAIGVTRMANRKAIIRRLPAVETMGSVTVICTDKTGTLTRNELAVSEVITATRAYQVTGSGYNDQGEILLQQQAVGVSQERDLQQVVYTAALCNEAHLTQDAQTWQLHGSPVDGALLALGLKAGISADELQARYPRLEMIPFQSEHKLMASLHRMDQQQATIFVKGAPEKILSLCAQQYVDGKIQNLNADYWQQQITRMAQQGQRILALACKPNLPATHKLELGDLSGELIFVGLLGLNDPPREQAQYAIARCLSAGIAVKMITGDLPATAVSIAQALGMPRYQKVLTGQALDQLSDAALRDAVREVDIFARTTPEHKIRLVKALQAQQAVVAMTGDGVNDAPALKQAEIGISMGIKGTDAAQEAAVMVLADDNFATIEAAVEEGRTVYDNLRKAILYILPNSGGEAVIILMAILFGYTLPITAVQILWINMLTTVALDLTLGFEPAEKGLMHQPPRRRDEPILSPLLLWRSLFVTTLFMLAGFGVFVYAMNSGAEIGLARTMVVNMIVAAEIAYLINCRKIYAATWHWQGLVGNRYLWWGIGLVVVLQLLLTYSPWMQQLFATQALSFTHWLFICGLALGIYLLVEIEKLFVRVYQARKL
jgi:calcium-translocating P-type ATPase